MAASNGDAAKYVYGVVRAGRGSRSKQSGINGEKVELVSRKGLGALVSDVPEDFAEAGRDELMTHSRVLEDALGSGTVLPMRFGVVMPSADAVLDELLDAHRVELEGQLDEMDGKVEVNIKGIYDEEALLREVVAENREVAELREAIQGQPEDATYYERIRLGEAITETIGAKQADDERAIVDRLLGCALQVEVGGPIHERMAVNASFLVERDGLKRFDSAVDQLGEEQAGRLRLKYTGPLPPYTFVELAVEAA